VAVHGLSGHRKKTWTVDDHFWLKEFLPPELPHARIFTFGYNSKLTFSKSAATIDDFAIGLLDELDNVRTNPEVLLTHEVCFTLTYAISGADKTDYIHLP
jgi:hypothetical protein